MKTIPQKEIKSKLNEKQKSFKMKFSRRLSVFENDILRAICQDYEGHLKSFIKKMCLRFIFASYF